MFPSIDTDTSGIGSPEDSSITLPLPVVYCANAFKTIKIPNSKLIKVCLIIEIKFSSLKFVK